MATARLEVKEPSGQRTVQIAKTPFRIGRREGSDLQLASGDVSRDHAEITTKGDGYGIRDDGSRYGTFVNDEEIKESALRHGDQIRLGRGDTINLTFLVSDGTTVEATQAPSSRGAIGEVRQVAALLEGLRALSSARVVDDVLILVLDSAISASGAERGFVMLADDKGKLAFTKGRSKNKKSLPGSGFKTSRSIPEQVFKTGKLRIVADLMEGDVSGQHQGTIALGIRNVLCVPIRLVRYTDERQAPADNETIGVLYLDSRSKGQLLSASTGDVLTTLANEAGVAIENAKLYRAALEKAKLEQEMRTAAEIQQALLPKHHRTGDFFEAAAATIPCHSIGGDFFEYFELPDGALGFALGDVAGKGPPAALLGAMMQGSLAAQALATVSPAVTIDAVNKALTLRGIQGRFVTLFYAVLYPDGRLTYCNAGHNAPMLVTNFEAVQRLETGGMVVGLFDTAEFEEATVQLHPDDYLVVFSDGVSEAFDSKEEEYGDPRLIDCLNAMTPGNAEERLEKIYADVKKFTAGAEQNDDVTAMIVTYRGSTS